MPQLDLFTITQMTLLMFVTFFLFFFSNLRYIQFFRKNLNFNFRYFKKIFKFYIFVELIIKFRWIFFKILVFLFKKTSFLLLNQNPKKPTYLFPPKAPSEKIRPSSLKPTVIKYASKYKTNQTLTKLPIKTTLLPSGQFILKEHIISYPTPINFNYLWSFGSLAGIFFVIQIISGVLLSMHYTPHIDFAFLSVEHIMRDVNFGWLFRYIHSNGASFVFIMLYMHIGKALYYQSFLFPYLKLWRIGVIIFLLMMATAFLGYVLPWGQMSLRGATVITNLFTAIPFIGESIAQWLWGGFSVDNATLNRFYSLHFLLPFLIIGFIVLHLILLHIPGSSNPLKIADTADKITFYPYFYLKDLFSFFVAIFFFSLFVFFVPNFLGHSDNYIPANPLSTPTHIVPEWYFLPFYAISRSIPDKLQGVVLMIFALLYLLILPIHTYYFQNFKFNQKVYYIHKNPKFRPVFRFVFWCFSFNFFLLGFIGGNPVESPYIYIGEFSTFFYFFSFILFFLSIFLDSQKKQ
jgi:ubiquinol-cytochrome c reductase cytochrome b subunit